jgi:glycosyltransferase involved in cell wall biosynthesis
LKIAFATVSDLRDIRQGSGTFYNLAQEIENQGHTVARVCPFTFDVPLTARLINSIHRRLGKRHPLFLDPFVGPRTGTQVNKRLANLEYDVLLTNDMSIAAFTTASKPVVNYTDVMITPDYSEKNLPGCRLGNMSALALGLCRQTLRQALRRSALTVFPAEWAARAARSYCEDHHKIKVIPFGANVADPGREIAQRRTWERVKAKGCLDLLFVGKDWIRKGGDVAVEAVRTLNASGMKARLHVVGAELPGTVSTGQVQQYGLLDKSKPEELELLKGLFTNADAFILPSSSEGYVISVLEAAAFGLPTLAYDADGVRHAVMDGRSGLLFPRGSEGQIFAKAVLSWRDRPEAYEALTWGARLHYETSANWRSCVSSLIGTITNTLQDMKFRQVSVPLVA